MIPSLVGWIPDMFHVEHFSRDLQFRDSDAGISTTFHSLVRNHSAAHIRP
jgi:hypothetical protein